MHRKYVIILAGCAMVTAVAGGAVAVACRNSDRFMHSDFAHYFYDPKQNLINTGQWSYMPGTSIHKDGLYVSHRDFSIVEQDGSGGQPNPPVNLYGTHLKVTGDFKIGATLKDIHGQASLQFYGSAPKVSDEFRVEPKSVRLTADSHTLTVRAWDGSTTKDLTAQTPTITQSFTFEPARDMLVQMTDQQNKLIFSVNGRVIGQLNNDSTFESGELWFGADAETKNGSFVVSKLVAQSLNGGTVEAVDTFNGKAGAKDPSGLQMLADKKRPGFLVGANAALWAAVSQDTYRSALLGGNFGIITPENDMKWQFTEPQPGVYDFRAGDALVNMAHTNGMQVHGHCLVFSEALPKWVQALPTNTTAQKAYVREVMVDHITQEVSHFKGRVSEWDVVNEPVKDYNNDGTFDTTQPLRENVFYRAMGTNYINIAFEAAHKADPEAKLYINDYGNENDDGARWHATYTLMKRLQASLSPQNIPTYFGFESHIYNPATDDISGNIADNGSTILANHIVALGALGIDSRISEMDAPLQDPGYTQDNSSQAAQFSGVLQTCLNNLHCTGFGMWSIGPTDLWQNDQHILQQSSVDSPFGQNMQPNGSYTALQKTLKN